MPRGSRSTEPQHELTRTVLAYLRREQLRLGLSDTDLAQRAGVSRPMLSRYYTGHKVPTFNEVARLCEALSLSLGDALPASVGVHANESHVQESKVPFMRPVAAAAAASVFALAACSSGGDSSSASQSSGSSAKSQTLTVYAAASLKKPFTKLGKQFEKENPGVTVKFNFAGSSDLAAQIKAGAPVDVLATADERTMGLVTSAKMMDGTPELFTKNKLTIVVPKGNPKDVKDPKDLAKPGLKLVVCASAVPCGKAAEKFEKNAKITVKPVSEEAKVTDVLAKVASGDGEAGVVYVSDAKTSTGDVESVSIPDDVNVINDYPIGVVKDSKNADLAKKFNAMVLGDQGQKELTDAGFLSAK